MNDYGFAITDNGRFLIAKLATGVKLKLTKTMVGSGRPVDCEAREMTDLSKPVAEATSTVPIYNEDRVEMVVEYRSDLNGGLKQGFWLNEFGVYAEDPDEGEILLYYGCLGDYPQWVSAASKTGVDVRRFPVTIIIGSGAEVEINFNSEAWMTAEDVKKYCEDAMLPELLKNVESNFSEELKKAGEALDIANEVKEEMENFSPSEITSQDIIIPTTGWTESEEISALSIDVIVDGITENMFPIVTYNPEFDSIAAACELNSRAKTGNGYIRLFAETAPSQPINAAVILLSPSASFSGGGSSLQPATKDRLGGVIIGDGVAVTAEGKISVATEDISATDADADDIINSIFGN